MDLNRLRHLVAEVDEEHHEAMRTLHDAINLAPREVEGASVADRRRFLRRLGLGGTALGLGGVALLAGSQAASAQTTTGGSSTPGGATAGGATTSTVATTTTTLPPQQPTTGDLPLLAFAQSVELAALSIYAAVVATGKLSEASAPIAAAFANHHRQHAEALSGVAGKAALNQPNGSLLRTYNPLVQAAVDEKAVLTILFQIETALTSTYVDQLGDLEGTNGVTVVASMQPIESRHAVVIGNALGAPLTTYTPSFEDPAKGISAADYPIIPR